MIFMYSNYIEWLQSELDARTAENPNYTSQLFAQALGISQSYLSLVMSEEKKLTQKSAKVIASKLKLNPAEREYLELLISLERAQGELKEFYAGQIQACRKRHIGELQMDVFEVIADWQYSAVLTALTCQDDKASIPEISKKLGLSQGAVAGFLEKLMTLNLVQRSEHDPEQFYSVRGMVLETSDGQKSYALRKFHKQILKKAYDAIENQTLEQRIVSGMTIAVDPARLPEVNELIKKFKQDLTKMFSENKQKNIYQVSIQFFDLKEE